MFPFLPSDYAAGAVPLACYVTTVVMAVMSWLVMWRY
jgi:hypothetical protein